MELAELRRLLERSREQGPAGPTELAFDDAVPVTEATADALAAAAEIRQRGLPGTPEVLDLLDRFQHLPHDLHAAVGEAVWHDDVAMLERLARPCRAKRSLCDGPRSEAGVAWLAARRLDPTWWNLLLRSRLARPTLDAVLARVQEGYDLPLRLLLAVDEAGRRGQEVLPIFAVVSSIMPIAAGFAALYDPDWGDRFAVALDAWTLGPGHADMLDVALEERTRWPEGFPVAAWLDKSGDPAQLLDVLGVVPEAAPMLRTATMQWQLGDDDDEVWRLVALAATQDADLAEQMAKELARGRTCLDLLEVVVNLGQVRPEGLLAGVIGALRTDRYGVNVTKGCLRIASADPVHDPDVQAFLGWWIEQPDRIWTSRGLMELLPQGGELWTRYDTVLPHRKVQ